jgi:hypothetical protein
MPPNHLLQSQLPHFLHQPSPGFRCRLYSMEAAPRMWPCFAPATSPLSASPITGGSCLARGACRLSTRPPSQLRAPATSPQAAASICAAHSRATVYEQKGRGLLTTWSTCGPLRWGTSLSEGCLFLNMVTSLSTRGCQTFGVNWYRRGHQHHSILLLQRAKNQRVPSVDYTFFLHSCCLYYYCSYLFNFYYFHAKNKERNNNSIPWDSFSIQYLSHQSQ